MTDLRFATLRPADTRQTRTRTNRIARVVVGSGRDRFVYPLSTDLARRMTAGSRLNEFLFPSPGSYHKAKRRGARALASRQSGENRA
jgi:hypothetical protein